MQMENFCQVTKLWSIITKHTGMLWLCINCLTNVLSGWLLNSCSSMNSRIGVHGCGLMGVEKPNVFGTVFDCVVGSTVLTAVGKLTV